MSKFLNLKKSDWLIRTTRLELLAAVKWSAWQVKRKFSIFLCVNVIVTEPPTRKYSSVLFSLWILVFKYIFSYRYIDGGEVYRIFIDFFFNFLLCGSVCYRALLYQQRQTVKKKKNRFVKLTPFFSSFISNHSRCGI